MLRTIAFLRSIGNLRLGISGIILVALVLPTASSQNRSQSGRGWQGIVPLHSTRADVVARLGPAHDKCGCIFRTSAETIVVDYADEICKGPIPGWKVPRDTVLQLRVTLKNPIPFGDLQINRNAYTKSQDGDDVMTVLYTNAAEGVRYAVQNNQVISVEYIPSTNDRNLRCEGFPQYNAGVTNYQPYDSFLIGTDIEMFARLDNFAFQLNQGRHWRGYVIGYAGRVSRSGEAKTVARRARNYLLNKRRVPPRKVIAVGGGFREKTQVELYLIHDGMPAPTPVPTLSLGEVRIIKRHR